MNEAIDIPLADRRIPAGGDWLSQDELAALTPKVLEERMKALGPTIAAAAREAEELRRPVDSVWDALRAAGYFYMYVPKVFGGLEVTTDEFIDITLPIAEACTSTAWTASFCAEHNWFLSHFPKETQAALFGGDFPYIVAPVVSFPPGKAERCEGGYRISGRWRWGTGVMHADWIMATSILAEEGKPPHAFMTLFPAADAQVLDTWHVSGMIGTGSNDIQVKDLFVPEAHTAGFVDMLTGRSPGSRDYPNPIYRMPMLPFLAMTAAISALGAARAALRDFRARMTAPGDVRLAEKSSAQIRLGKAAALIGGAEQIIRQAGRDNVASGALGPEKQLAERLRNRAAIALGVSMCRDAVGVLAEAAGSSLAKLDQPFQRAVRDMSVICTHVVFDLDAAYELQGRGLVGLSPNATLY